VKTGTATLTFNTFSAGPTIDFAPIENLPDGVTYVLTDDKGIHESTVGYEVDVTPYSAGLVDFTQTYKIGDQTLVTQTVRTNVTTLGGKKFSSVSTVNTDESITPGILPVDLSFDVEVPELP
jgi:hypothetical protein